MLLTYTKFVDLLLSGHRSRLQALVQDLSQQPRLAALQ